MFGTGRFNSTKQTRAHANEDSKTSQKFWLGPQRKVVEVHRSEPAKLMAGSLYLEQSSLIPTWAKTAWRSIHTFRFGNNNPHSFRSLRIDHSNRKIADRLILCRSKDSSELQVHYMQRLRHNKSKLAHHSRTDNYRDETIRPPKETQMRSQPKLRPDAAWSLLIVLSKVSTYHDIRKVKNMSQVLYVQGRLRAFCRWQPLHLNYSLFFYCPIDGVIRVFPSIHADSHRCRTGYLVWIQYCAIYHRSLRFSNDINLGLRNG